MLLPITAAGRSEGRLALERRSLGVLRSAYVVRDVVRERKLISSADSYVRLLGLSMTVYDRMLYYLAERNRELDAIKRIDEKYIEHFDPSTEPPGNVTNEFRTEHQRRAELMDRMAKAWERLAAGESDRNRT